VFNSGSLKRTGIANWAGLEKMGTDYSKCMLWRHTP
jgi:hypothetical protein